MPNLSSARHGIVALAMVMLVVATSSAQPPESLDLEAALEISGQNNHLLRAARDRILEAEGDLIGASLLLLHNPELEFSLGPRYSFDLLREKTTDFEVGVDQRLEIAGQRGRRIEWATANVDASHAGADDTQRVIELAVAMAFYDTLAGEERVGLMGEAEELAESLYEVARLRFELGEGSRLELATAQIRFAEARRRTLVANRLRRSSSIVLAELLGLGGEDQLTLVGDLPTAQTTPGVDDFVDRALELRPDLLAGRHGVEAATAAVEVARKEGWPDASVGFHYAREEGDDIYLAKFSVPLPLFNRNQGQTVRARGTLARLRSELDAGQLAVESEVRRAYVAYEQAGEAAQIYSAEVLAAQEESLELLTRAFEVGEADYAAVMIVQRELIEGREGYLDARLDLARAQARLLAAASLSQMEGLRDLR